MQETAVQTPEITAETPENTFKGFLRSLEEQFEKFMESIKGTSKIAEQSSSNEEIESTSLLQEDFNKESSSLEEEELNVEVLDLIETNESIAPPDAILSNGTSPHPAAIEIKMEETYNIKVVASEVMAQIAALQQEVSELRERMKMMLTAEEVEQKIVEAVGNIKLQVV